MVQGINICSKISHYIIISKEINGGNNTTNINYQSYLINERVRKINTIMMHMISMILRTYYTEKEFKKLFLLIRMEKNKFYMNSYE